MEVYSVKWTFLYGLKNGQRRHNVTSQQILTDIMTVRSYFLQKELDFLSIASILVLSSDILVDGVQRNVCHPILFLESFHGKSKTFKFWMFFNKLM